LLIDSGKCNLNLCDYAGENVISFCIWGDDSNIFDKILEDNNCNHLIQNCNDNQNTICLSILIGRYEYANKIINKYLQEKDIDFLNTLEMTNKCNFYKGLDIYTINELNNRIRKYMYDNKHINKIWSIYQKEFMKIIDNSISNNNILASCFQKGIGDLNVITLITQFIY